MDSLRNELIVQITDPHLTVGPGDGASAAAVSDAVDAIGRLDPAPVAVLLTGDLADGGAPAEYARMRELLAPLAMPVHPIPGNHDDRDALRDAFADHPGIARTSGFVHYTARCGAVRVIMCDSIVPGSDRGSLDGGRLDRLEAELSAEPGAPTILAMHHPPILSGIREADEIGIPAEDRDALAGLVGAAAHVQRIVAGHNHRAFTGRLATCPVFVCPSVYLQGLLDLGPVGRMALVPEPPALAIHVHGADRELLSHVQPIVASVP